MILSVHIPKCAGTSFRHILHRLYGEGVWDNYGVVFSADDALAERVPPRTVCIHGHFLADTFDELYPERKLITWIRHPVDRVVSHYQHFLRAPDMHDDCCRALYERNLSLREFSELDWMRNEASRYLTGKPIEDFAFVGVVERFTESLALFSELFADGRRLPEPCDNANPARKTPNYPLSHSDHAFILSRNLADFILYQRALERLDERQRVAAGAA